MSKTIPQYLRIHHGPNQRPSVQSAAAADPIDQFWQAYIDATGWRVDRKVHPVVPAPTGLVPTLLPALTPDLMESAETLDSIPLVSRSGAIRLAQAADRVFEQLSQARDTIRLQEAELTARAAVLGERDRADFASRIEAILRAAMAATGCVAAALYLLDDDTAMLHRRASYGLATGRVVQSSRPLRGSRGDLEALVEEVVTVEDATRDWSDGEALPEPFPAGICVSINDGDLPIGTLWLFADQPSQFSSQHVGGAIITASHLATEIAGAGVGRGDLQRSGIASELSDLSQWQLRTLPSAATLADGWVADGMIESFRSWSTGWHWWDVLPDGSLMLAIAEAEDGSIDGAMTAASARVALTAHSGYRHTPREMIERIGDTLWQTNTGDQLVSMLYARIDAETGEGEVAAAGSTLAMIANRYGFRPVTDGKCDPIGTHIDTRSTAETFRLAPGEVLCAYGQGLHRDGANQRLVGETLRDAMLIGGRSPLAAVRRALADHPLQHERGAVSLTRCDATS